MEETVLREQLRTVDESLLFLLLIVLSVLLSYWGVRIQREGLCRTLQGDAEGAAALPRVFPIRLSASALVVGALGFFLCLALKTERETARGGTPAARRSACTNLWASLFVFLAALLRLDDLLGTRDASGMRVSLPAPWQKRYKPRWPPSGPCRR